MNKVFNRLSTFRDGILEMIFNRNTEAHYHGKPLTEAQMTARGIHFNDNEEEEGPQLAFRGTVGFVTNKLFAMMTLFNRREDNRYAEWERENRHRQKHVVAEVTGAPHLLCLEPEVE
jgi:hypothetical protein